MSEMLLIPRSSAFSAAYETWLRSEFDFTVFSTDSNPGARRIETPSIPLLQRLVGAGI